LSRCLIATTRRYDEFDSLSYAISSICPLGSDGNSPKWETYADRLRRLRLLKNNGQPYEGEAPRYYQCFELSFDSQEDMDFCMASEARKLTRKQSAADIGTFKGLFIGEVHHVNYEVTDIPIPSKW